jgi:hypothetical protein
MWASHPCKTFVFHPFLYVQSHKNYMQPHQNQDNQTPMTLVFNAKLGLVLWFFHSTKSHCTFCPNLEFKSWI